MDEEANKCLFPELVGPKSLCFLQEMKRSTNSDQPVMLEYSEQERLCPINKRSFILVPILPIIDCGHFKTPIILPESEQSTLLRDHLSFLSVNHLQLCCQEKFRVIFTLEFGMIESLDLLVFYILDETIEGVG